MATPKEKTAFTLTISRHLMLKIKILGYQRDMTQHQIIEMILRDYFKQQRRDER